MDAPCTHRTPVRWVWRDVEVSPFGDTEQQLVEEGGKSTEVDLDTGRFRCTQCGRIGYYTGLWRDFYERGIPCPGSDSISPRPALYPETCVYRNFMRACDR